MKTITFKDIESGEESVVIVRTVGNQIGLCLSLEKGADVEVFMPESIANEVSLALNEATGKVENT